MQKELAKLYNEYNNSAKDVKDFAKESFELVVSQNDLRDYVKELKPKELLNTNIGGYFDTKQKNLVINCHYDEKYNAFKAKEIERDSKSILLARILCSVIHELDHVRFFKEVDNKNVQSIYELANYTQYKYAKSNKEICKNIIERLMLKSRIKTTPYFQDSSELSAHYYSIDLLKRIYNELEKSKDDNVSLALILEAESRKMLEAYQDFYVPTSLGITNSPTYDGSTHILGNKYVLVPDLVKYEENPMELYKDNKREYSLEDRIRYGLQLSNDERNKLINSVQKDQIVFRNNCERKLAYLKNKR